MDDERFEATYTRYLGNVYRYCLYRTGSPLLAEDLTAESFARLLESDGDMSDTKALSWLLRVAHNLSVDRLRRDARLATTGVPETAVAFPDGEVWIDTDVREAMWSLSPLHQKIVFLRLIEDRSFADVASLVGRGEGSVRVLYGRALKRLRVYLERGEE